VLQEINMKLKKLRCLLGAVLFGVLNLFSVPAFSVTEDQAAPPCVNDTIGSGAEVNPRRHSDVI
jgi:hypothetical protein